MINLQPFEDYLIIFYGIQQRVKNTLSLRKLRIILFTQALILLKLSLKIVKINLNIISLSFK